MIRLSTHNDLQGIVAVWKEAFGDSEKDIRFFLDAQYKPENTVVYDSGGEIASVLFLIDGDMRIKGIDYPSYYLYAACTLRKFRGRGIMSEMLEFSKKLAFKRNKYFIALKPGEDSLYNYYSKFGYKPVFTKKKAVFDIIEPIEYNSNIIDYDRFRWSDKSIEFAVEHHKYYGGNVILKDNYYLLFNISDNVLFVKENTFPVSEFICLIIDKASENNADKISAELPSGFGIECSNSEIIKSGMLLPVSSEAEKIITTVENAYLSLTLD